jgi:hypothetical protein
LLFFLRSSGVFRDFLVVISAFREENERMLLALKQYQEMPFFKYQAQLAWRITHHLPPPL